MKFYKHLPTCLALSLGLSVNNVWAVAFDVNITGTIIEKPCEITADANGTDIDFGSISIDDVDGIQNSEEISFSIRCTDSVANATAPMPSLKITGTQLPSAPTNVLYANAGTDNEGKFGLAFYQGSSVNDSYPAEIGGGIEGKGYLMDSASGAFYHNSITGNPMYSNGGVVHLTVVPFKLGTGDLKAHTFTASATIQAFYP